MSKTCNIRTGQVKFGDRKPDWACKIVNLRNRAKQTSIPFLKSKQGQICRDTNWCHCRRYGKLIILKFPNCPCFGKKKKSSGLCNFFGASKFCLFPSLWACDEKKSCEDYYMNGIYPISHWL